MSSSHPNHAAKRRRTSSAKDMLRTSILQSFRSNLDCSADAHAANEVHPRASRKPIPPAARVHRLTAALRCVSTSEGLAAVEALQKALVGRAVATAAVSEVLLEDEEDAPPLCCFAHLIDCGAIRAVDLRPSSVSERARMFLGEQSDACECSKAAGGPLEHLISAIASSGRSRVRDAILRALVRPLLSTGSNVLHAGSSKVSFNLVQRAVEVLRNVDMDPEDRAALLTDWTRTSISVTHSASSCMANNSGSSIWTRELFGIASGESVGDFLPFRETEETALEALFGSVSPMIAGQVFLSTLSSIFQDIPAQEVEPGVAGCPVNWPRALLLARRSCDSRKWNDVESSERASFSGCLHAALCAPHVARQPRLVSYILVVTRYLFRCSRNEKSADDIERGYREYDKWLFSVASSQSKIAVKSLCACLCDLVPVEPARYLKASVKIFLRAHRVTDVVKDYIVLARTRIADIESSNDGQHGAEPSGNLAADLAVKAASDVARFVAEFTRAGNVIPSSLVRQMNFHRHHFRTKLLEPLLSSDLRPENSYLEEEFPDTGLRGFNEQRVCMVKMMAFERKDKAVSRAEAEKAIAGIKEQMAKSGAIDMGEMPVQDDAVELTIESSVPQMVCGIARACVVESRASCALSPSLSNASATRIAGLLSSKLASLGRAEGGDLFGIVSELLHASLSAIASSQDSSWGQVETERRDGGGLNCRSAVVPLLETCQTWICLFVRDVLGDCRLARLRRAFQHRLLLLLCKQSELLSVSHIKALSVLTFCLTALSEEPCLQDLVFVLEGGMPTQMRHLVDVIASQLDVGSEQTIMHSFRFAVTYLELVLSQPFPKTTLQTSVKAGPAALEKENMSPTAACLEDEPAVIPCSQSTSRQGEEGLGNSAPARGFVNYLPAGFVQLLRWVMSCLWRLRVAPSSLGGDCANDLIDLVSGAVTVLESSVCCDMDFDVDSWVTFELRAGWGCEAEAADVVRRYVISSRMKRSSVLGSVARAIAERERGQAENDQHRSSSAPYWLTLALGSVARDGVSLDKGYKCPSRGSAGFLWSVECLAVKIRQALCAAAAIDTMFRTLAHLPAEFYFELCPPDIVAQHIPMALAPLLWPFSSTVVRVLLVAFLERKDPAPDICAIPALTAAVACHWPSLRESSAVVETAISASRPARLLSQAEAIWAAVNGSIDRENIPFGTASGTGFASAALDVLREERSAFASALVVLPFLEAQRRASFTCDCWASRLSVFMKSVYGSADVGPAFDLMDNVAELSARSPFVGAARMDALHAVRWDEWSMASLVVVMEARMELCDAADAAMFKFDASNVDDLSSVSVALEDLGLRGLLPEKHSANSQSRKGPERGRPSLSSNPGSTGANLIGTLSKGRMVAAYAKLSEVAWSRLVRMHDAGGDVEVFLLLLIDFAVFLSRRVEKELRGLAGRQPGVWTGARAVAPRTQRGVHVAIERCAAGLRRPVGHVKINEKFKALNPTLWGSLVGEM